LSRQRSGLRTVSDRPAPYTAAPLEREREKITNLKAELDRVAATGLDRVTIETRIAERVQAMADSVNVRLQGERGGTPLIFTLDGTEGGLHQPTALEALAWLSAPALTARLLAAIPTDEAGLSPSAKAKATERLSAELLAAERREEAMIEAAEIEGVSVERRLDASPEAVLGVAVVQAEAEAA
jgi:hypothetical protein